MGTAEAIFRRGSRGLQIAALVTAQWRRVRRARRLLLAAVSCDMLFKRKPCLLGIYASFVCGAVEPSVFLSC